jgi:spermidine synthase
MGDGRLSLEREDAREKYDVLAVDAFSGDAIPIHLLTKEAFALYWQHLKPNGVLAVHVSNDYVDLAPVVTAAATETNKSSVIIENAADAEKGIRASRWVLIASGQDLLDRAAFKNQKLIRAKTDVRVWADDYSNLWRVLRLR